MDIMRMGEKNPNYLGAFDLYDMANREITVTIKSFYDENVASAGREEVVTVCNFAEDHKPMILNPTNKKRLSKLFQTKDTEKMVGKRITIVIEKVKAFGKISDALRIKEVLPSAKDRTCPSCEICGGEIKGMGNKNALQVAEYTKLKYRQYLCSTCATKKASEEGGSGHAE